ncbi:hypothetical protein HN011_001390 [Eciton burchellii]|nr:hypothetical protein HN011_001390 [Eciton burchellii]
MEVPHCRPLMFPPTSARVTYSLSARGNCGLNVPRKPNAINCVYALEFNCPQLCAICSSCYMDHLRCYISSSMRASLINIEQVSFIVTRTPIIGTIVNDQSTRILKLGYSYFRISGISMTTSLYIQTCKQKYAYTVIRTLKPSNSFNLSRKLTYHGCVKSIESQGRFSTDSLVREQTALRSSYRKVDPDKESLASSFVLSRLIIVPSNAPAHNWVRSCNNGPP